MFLFSPYLEKIPNLTNIFQMGWFNHQLNIYIYTYINIHISIIDIFPTSFPWSSTEKTTRLSWKRGRLTLDGFGKVDSITYLGTSAPLESVKRVGQLVAKGGGLMFENLGNRLVFFGFISDVCIIDLFVPCGRAFYDIITVFLFSRCFVAFRLCVFFLTQCRIKIGLEHLEVLILFSRWHLYQTAQVSAGWSDSMTTLHRVVCFCGDVPATKNQSQEIFESSCTEEQN